MIVPDDKIISAIVTKFVQLIKINNIDMSDFQFTSGFPPYFRGFPVTNVMNNESYDVTSFHIIPKWRHLINRTDLPPYISNEQIRDFLLTIMNTKQTEIFNTEKQISFRWELTDSDHYGKLLAVFRVTGYYQREKYSVSLRMLKTRIPDPNEIHIHPFLYDMNKPFITADTGLILISGPTGGGKTTTAVSLLKQKLLYHSKVRNKGILHLVTVESPIEYEFVVDPDVAVVDQREVGIDTPDYPTATKDIVRINPNIIFVGEVRDPETAVNCLQIASNGHLVVATFHASSIADTILRYRSFLRNESDESMFANVLHAIINQRIYTHVVSNSKKTIILPVSEAVVVDNAIRELILTDRVQELVNYINIDNGIRMKDSMEFIRSIINREIRDSVIGGSERRRKV